MLHWCHLYVKIDLEFIILSISLTCVKESIRPVGADAENDVFRGINMLRHHMGHTGRLKLC